MTENNEKPLSVFISTMLTFIGVFLLAQQCSSLQPLAAPAVERKTMVSSLETIRRLAEKSSLRQRGSKSYQKAWRHWLHSTVDVIRNELAVLLPDPVDERELENLSFSLGVAADIGEMPSFADAGARSGYALDYFCRARLLADLLIDVDNPSLPDYWTDVTKSHSLFGQNENSMFDNPGCHLASLGGGPGFDYVAATLVSTFNAAGASRNTVPIHATIFDYESGWSNLVHAMNKATNNVLPFKNLMSCNWGGICDITKSLYDATNAGCLALANSTTIWTCQYCVAENAKQLRDSDYVFFRDLFDASANNSLFVITETTPRMWPEFYDILVEHNQKNNNNGPMLKIGFPYKRGQQMIIFKTDKKNNDEHPMPMISSRDMELLNDFEKYSQKHEQLIESGWERQKSKRMTWNEVWLVNN